MRGRAGEQARRQNSGVRSGSPFEGKGLDNVSAMFQSGGSVPVTSRHGTPKFATPAARGGRESALVVAPLHVRVLNDIDTKPQHQSRAARGFTLIELLVVCVIIALLAGILLPALYRSKRQAKVQQAKAEMRAIKSAILAYHLQNRNWPLPGSDLEPGTQGSNEKDYAGDNYLIINVLTNQMPPMLDPADFPRWSGATLQDPWGAAYSIRIDKDHDGFYRGNTNDLVPDGVVVSNVNLSFTY